MKSFSDWVIEYKESQRFAEMREQHLEQLYEMPMFNQVGKTWAQKQVDSLWDGFGDEAKKIGRLGSEDVYEVMDPMGGHMWFLVKGGKATFVVHSIGMVPRHARVNNKPTAIITIAAKTISDTKLTDFYQWIMKNKRISLISDELLSTAAYKAWRRMPNLHVVDADTYERKPNVRIGNAISKDRTGMNYRYASYL